MSSAKICSWILIFIVVCSHIKLVAQDSTIGHISISSPTAASLGRYGDIPVSYNTGIPNINIPVYTIVAGKIKLPLNLSYHSGGIKTQDQASWVGTGWSLNAGGVITRTVIGAPDDRGLNAAHTTYGYFSDYGVNNYLFTAGSGSCGGTGPACPIGSSYPADDISIMAGTKDGEPDLYFFNFNGYTGKFYFNDDQTPIVVPEEDFKISPIYPYAQNQVSPIGILGFTITTADGSKYTFGKNPNSDGNIDATEITTYITGKSPANTGQGAVSSWFLNRIVSADGMDSINLVYSQDKYSFYELSMFPVTPTGLDVWASNTEYDLVKNFINGVRLNKIVFPNGEVDFSNGIVRSDLDDYNSIVIGEVANTTSSSLGSIIIKDNNGYCKKDSFYFSYFHDATSSLSGTLSNAPYNTIVSDSYRLKLDSIQEISCDGSLKIPPYKFNYFSELPLRKLSFGVDHWGYMNGMYSNQTLIPTYQIFSGYSPNFYQGADRDAHWPAMRGGALQQITYPTGGYTQFNFEANDTYCNYNTYTKNTFGFSGCYDGSNSGTAYYTTSGASDIYLLVLTNTTSGDGMVQIGSLGSYHVAGGTTDSTYLTLPANTQYTLTISVSYPLTGHGISGTFIDYSPINVSGNVIVGGLRIKTITKNDGLTANSIITSYAYNTGGSQSSGILYSRPAYVQILRNDIAGQVFYPLSSSINVSVNGCVSPDASPSKMYYKSPCSIRPMETVQGNHIGYNQVQVSQSNNGYSIYRYYGSNFWDYNISDVCVRNINIGSCSASIPNYPAAPLPFDFPRGELKYEGHFNQQGQVVKDIWYFPQYVQDSIFTPALIVSNVVTSTLGQGSGVTWGTEYALRSASKIQDSVVTTLHDPLNGTYITTTDISYSNSPYHHQQNKKATYSSTNDTLATTIKYAQDFRITNCDTISNGWHSYFSSYTGDSLTFYNSLTTCTSTGGWNCKWIAYQQYRFNRSTDRKNYVTLRRSNYMDAGNRYSACYLTALSTADTLLKPILRLRNTNEIKQIETARWKNTNLIHASFTRYDTSQSPIGYSYPGRTKLINLQSPSISFTNSTVSGNSINMDSRYIDESFYIYSGGNPLQVLLRDGVTNSYIWDYNNSRPIAKVTNASQVDIAYTSFESYGKGNWTFSGLATSGSSPTGSKYYTLTSQSMSKSGLSSGTIYVVSYWSSTSSSYTVTGSTSVTKGKTINGWTYFEHTVTGNTAISISGTGNIDEVRLYPTTSQMTTYTYSPLIGTTAQCDVDNRITYYYYDALGRLKWIKDQDGNIVKTIQYHYQGINGFQY